MYSGKSTELMRRVNRLTSIGMRWSSTNDKRPGVQNHDGQRLEAIKTTELLVGTGQYNVAIDEGQFFSNLRVAVTLMVEHGKHVIVAER